MEEFLEGANVDFRNITPNGDNQPSKMVVTLDSLKKTGEEPLKIDTSEENCESCWKEQMGRYHTTSPCLL